MGREGSLKRTVERKVRDRGGWLVKLNPSNGAGVPDVVFCYRGFFVAAELKAPNATGSAPASTAAGRRKLQEHELAQVRGAGGVAVLWWRPDQVDELLDTLDTRTRR